jgi:hypothetical protein
MNGQPRFLQETGFGFGILAGGVGQYLHHYSAVDHRIAGAIYVRHAAAQEFKQLVFSESCGKLHAVLR